MSDQHIPQVVRDMYQYYMDGHSQEEVGHQFHYSQRTVSWNFRRYGLPARTPQETRCVRLEAETSIMHSSGMNAKQLAKAYGLAHETVIKRLRKYGRKKVRT